MNNLQYSGGDTKKDQLSGFLRYFLLETGKVFYTAYFTADAELSKYACYVEQISKTTRQVMKKLYFDVTVKGFYDSYFLLERERFDYLKSMDNGINTTIYYVVFNPQNTVIFNLTELEKRNKLKWEPSKKIAGKIVAVLRVYEAKEVGYVHGKTPLPAQAKQTTEIRQPNYDPQPIQQHTSSTPPTFSNPIENRNNPITEDFFPMEDESELFPAEQPIPSKISNNDILVGLPDAVQDQKYGIERNEDGQLVWKGMEFFRSLPESIRNDYADRNLIINHFKDKTQRQQVLQEYGSIQALAKSLRDQKTSKIMNKGKGN